MSHIPSQRYLIALANALHYQQAAEWYSALARQSRDNGEFHVVPDFERYAYRASTEAQAYVDDMMRLCAEHAKK